MSVSKVLKKVCAKFTEKMLSLQESAAALAGVKSADSACVSVSQYGH